MKRGLVVAVAAAIFCLVPFASQASAETGGGGCVFDAQLNFTDPIVLTPEKSFGYTLNGNLSQCQGIAAPASAVIFAGLYGYPVPTGNGSCANVSSHGIMIVYWADRTVTVLNYGTAGPLQATVIEGNAQPAIGNYKTTRFIGGTATGSLVLTEGNPLDCTSPTGIGVATAKGHMTFASQ